MHINSSGYAFSDITFHVVFFIECRLMGGKRSFKAV